MKKMLIKSMEYKNSYDKDAFTPVEAFISLFQQEQYAGIIIVLNSKFLRNKKEFNINKKIPFKKISSENINVKSLIKSCVSHGHMSILFLPNSFTSFIKSYFQNDYYNIKGQKILLGTGLGNDPLNELQLCSFSELIASDLITISSKGCMFSHDADFFYTIDFSCLYK
jgi:hypothetical protein